MTKQQVTLEQQLREAEKKTQDVLKEIKLLEKQNKELSKKRSAIMKRVKKKLSPKTVKLFATLTLLQYKQSWSRNRCVLCDGLSNMVFDAGNLGDFGLCLDCFDIVLEVEHKIK
jgi:hypothetical protein